MGGSYSTHGRDEILVIKPEGMRPLERFKRRCENNVTLDLRGIGCE
jgi:hypothetical protein